MKVVIRGFVVALIGFACLGSARLLFPSGDSPSERERLRGKVSLFMRGKLHSSQQVLEGLTTENFEMIRQGSEKSS